MLGEYERTFNLLITEPSGIPAPVITNDTLLDGIQGTFYSDFVLADGDDLEFAIFSGVLPTGLSLNQYTGEISGTPFGFGGVFNFAIICFNVGGFDIKSYQIFIATPPLIISRSLPDGIIGQEYSFQINSVGDTPQTFTVITPTINETGLPNGISLSTSGILGGIVNDTEGVYVFTVKSQNSSGYDTVQYTLNVFYSNYTWMSDMVTGDIYQIDKLFIEYEGQGYEVDEAYAMYNSNVELIYKATTL